MPNWEAFNSISQLEEILSLSHEVPCIIFKHSTRCGISLHVKSDVEEDWNLTDEQVKMYYLDLLSFREVSNFVASSLNVTHQSPQIIILKGGKVIYYVSHRAINNADIEKYVLG